MSLIGTVNLFNSGSDYAVRAFGLPQGLPESVTFDVTGSFIIPANSSTAISADYDGTPVTIFASLYPRNLFVASSVGIARFYAVPNFVVVTPPTPPPPPPPPSPSPAPPGPSPSPPPDTLLYTLSVNSGSNILSTVGSGLYEPGRLINVDMTPATGYVFAQWIDNDEILKQPITVKSNTVLMPATDTSITPVVLECFCVTVTVLAGSSSTDSYVITYLDCTGTRIRIRPVPIGLPYTINTIDDISIVVFTDDIFQIETPDVSIVPC